MIMVRYQMVLFEVAQRDERDREREREREGEGERE